ncbi:bifunctional phosphopantothenoylcysteine decarboxylase/phosphopantothenate synthase [Nostocoides australiense]|nr:bifunctional phosphopantothenoylcysteine decarboxylase/phosphopantothenate synthase [Tetrasphaera australiensis]HRW00298.1 bifunctional phosphopantothenoylcysteine decarboxylase/phosphopantothenate synthase [Tetrasphaera sp.]
MNIVLGVGGGIAAYKAALLLRLFTESGHSVTVIPTAAALHFVGEPTWSALSGKPVQTDVWTHVEQVPHVRLGQQADLVVIAPATADLLARAAAGLADDLLTNTLLTARCPVVYAPAMHTEMWEHPATQANVETLIERGAHIVPPASGRLTGADTGPGRLPDPEEIFAVCRHLLEHGASPSAGEDSGRGAPAIRAATGTRPGPPARRTSSPRQQEPDYTGWHVLISAGGTREPLDPVRFLGNRSSGKQGFALAARAAARGALVKVVSANVSLPVPEGVEVIPVGTALEMQAAVEAQVGWADLVIMAAAVADFRPAAYAGSKIKKTHDPADPDAAPVIELVRNPDILAGLVQARGPAPRPVIVGFAAETGDADHSVLRLGEEKLARKGCDLLVVNEVGVDKTFGSDENTVHILRKVGAPVAAGPAGKDVIADAILDAARPLMG